MCKTVLYVKKGAARLVILVALVGLISLSSSGASAQTGTPDRPVAIKPVTQFGILYTGWHCLVVRAGRAAPPNIADAIAGKRPWGPIPEFHYWAEPKDGYYCLSERPDVLRQHAELLREAGIDFIVFDATNNEFADARTPDSPRTIAAPFERLLITWSEIPGAPKVVPWAPLTTQGNMLHWMLARLEQYPRLRFVYNGKPLALITENTTYATDNDRVASLEGQYTVRRMWSTILHPTDWSFLSQCQRGFRESQGRIACRQPVTVRNGAVEQVSIAAAYQETYMSFKETAVPKFQGRTFVRQFETLARTPTAPVAVISDWNEWMAQRICITADRQPTAANCSATNDHWSDGTKIFVDAYDSEYSRDIEPSKDSPRDFYYRLMKHCIALFGNGLTCQETDIRFPK